MMPEATLVPQPRSPFPLPQRLFLRFLDRDGPLRWMDPVLDVDPPSSHGAARPERTRARFLIPGEPNRRSVSFCFLGGALDWRSFWLLKKMGFLRRWMMRSFDFVDGFGSCSRSSDFSWRGPAGAKSSSSSDPSYTSRFLLPRSILVILVRVLISSRLDLWHVMMKPNTTEDERNDLDKKKGRGMSRKQIGGSLQRSLQTEILHGISNNSWLCSWLPSEM